MPALLINIKIDDASKYDLFTHTLRDVSGAFNECHAKFRGAFAHQCLDYARITLINVRRLTFYQDLQEHDWVTATAAMLAEVHSRSIFLYWEDHALVSTQEHLTDTLRDFDHHSLDYACYSFFSASALGVENLLPLSPVKTTAFHIIQYTQGANEIVGKISHTYCSSSLVSIFSVQYFAFLLLNANPHIKLYSKTVHAALARISPYPRYRKWYHRINKRLRPLGAALCPYPPSSPFNLERMWFETEFRDGPWMFGILTRELFANYDDDNGVYRESLVKRGLYPFDATMPDTTALAARAYVDVQITLSSGETHDCTYFTRAGRIRTPPLLQLLVTSGCVHLWYRGKETTIEEGTTACVYANQSPVVRSIGAAVIRVRVYDEAF